VNDYTFASTIRIALFYGVAVVVFLPETVGTFRDRVRPGAERRDRGSKWVLMACLGAGTWAAFVLVHLFPEADATGAAAPALFYGGLLLMASGAAFRWYAIGTLGEAFTRTVMVRTDQEVVAVGPYRWIRHPSYAGGLVTFVGIGLALCNAAAVVPTVVATAAGYAYRIRVEEHALREALGARYEAYAERTPDRLIPFLW